MLGRPRYISETRASPSDSLKCLTLGLGRMTGMFAWGAGQRLEKLLPKPRMSPERPYTLHPRFRKSMVFRLRRGYAINSLYDRISLAQHTDDSFLWVLLQPLLWNFRPDAGTLWP